jgi:hypothetical protein
MKAKTPKKLKRLPAIAPNRPQFSPCEDHVGSLLSAHARRKDKSRLGGDWLHVSALIGGDCLRAYLIASKEQVVADIKPMVADRMLWAIGKTVEAHIREAMVELYGAENCLGRWKCSCGKTEFVGIGGDETECGNCGSGHHRYDEINLRDEETRLTGSPDFIVRNPRTKKWTVVEIKSIKVVPKNGVRNGSPEFHTLEAPQRNHSLQALLYRWLLKRLGYDVTDEVLVIYGAKDYVQESPYKPFSVDGEAEENVIAVNNLVALASEYADAQRKGTLLPRIPHCSSCTTSRAKACPCVTSCFSRRA